MVDDRSSKDKQEKSDNTMVPWARKKQQPKPAAPPVSEPAPAESKDATVLPWKRAAAATQAESGEQPKANVGGEVRKDATHSPWLRQRGGGVGDSKPTLARDIEEPAAPSKPKVEPEVSPWMRRRSQTFGGDAPLRAVDMDAKPTIADLGNDEEQSNETDDKSSHSFESEEIEVVMVDTSLEEETYEDSAPAQDDADEEESVQEEAVQEEAEQARDDRSHQSFFEETAKPATNVEVPKKEVRPKPPRRPGLIDPFD